MVRTQLDIIMDVEAELARHGYADPSASLFRGCHICLLPHSKLQSATPEGAGDPSQAGVGSSGSGQRLFQSTQALAKAAAATEQALLACQAKRISLQACTLLPLVVEILQAECTSALFLQALLQGPLHTRTHAHKCISVPFCHPCLVSS